MRRDIEIENFRTAMFEQYGESSDVANYNILCFEACIPKTFWNIRSKDVTHNIEVFKEVVVPYREKWKKAHKNGYSLLFTSSNGSGKTYFISYILTQIIKRNLTAYYTTLTQLDIDIKRSFGDKDVGDKLECMLDSDFVAIDEVGKEQYKSDSYIKSRLEHFLKRRHDDGDPVLLASNLSYDDLCSMYGTTFESIIDGKYRIVSLEPGDFRKEVKKRMKVDMGYK